MAFELQGESLSSEIDRRRTVKTEDPYPTVPRRRTPVPGLAVQSWAALRSPGRTSTRDGSVRSPDPPPLDRASDTNVETPARWRACPMDSSPCSRCVTTQGSRARAPPFAHGDSKKHDARRSRRREERAPPRAGRRRVADRRRRARGCRRTRAIVFAEMSRDAVASRRRERRDRRLATRALFFALFEDLAPLGPAPDPRPPPHRRRTGTSTSPDSTRP